jgi:hypothetical protein
MGWTINPQGIFVGKLDDRKIHGKLRLRWEDNIAFVTTEI